MIKLNKTWILLSLSVLVCFVGCSKPDSTQIEQLRTGFLAPPLEARPRALWDWVDGNFQLEEITREMEEAARMGMGGFDIWDVRSVVDEAHIMDAGPPFMSDESLEGICHAINEAERLGLDLGLIIASGWNAGGIWTLPEHQTMGLFSSATTISGPGEISLQLEFPVLPDQFGTENRQLKIRIPRELDGTPKFFKEVSVIAYGMDQPDSVTITGEIIDLSNHIDREGTLKWDVPEGDWNVVRYICANTGQPMISSSPNSMGPMIDHFNAEASEQHIQFFIDKIEAKLGKFIGESGLTYFYTDSYEVQGQLWTPEMTDEFQDRMGYSMVPYLPALDGLIVKDHNITSRFLYDYRRVLSDLIIENHYAHTRDICEYYGVGFVAEAAGPGWPVHNCPFESLKSSGSLSFPRGEFWHLPTNTGFWRKMKGTDQEKHYLEELQVIKGVASASHIYNQKYVEAEAFTGTHLWNEGPGDLKPTADRAFCEGLNRINFHTWPHTPEEAGTPGWVYAFGTLINEHRIWWPMAKPWMEYLGRCSYMLQQGNFVGDVLFYYGDSVPNFVPAKKILPGLGFGYDYDVTNSDVLLNNLIVDEGKLVLPHGQSYEMLVLPEESYMQPEILEKIEDLVWNGATVVGPKPVRSHGLLDWEVRDLEVRNQANELWGDCDGENILHTKYGMGHIYWGEEIRSVLTNSGVYPDFDFKGNMENTALDYIHRKVGNEDIYFIRNSTAETIKGTAIFRQKKKIPEFWDPATGKMFAVNKIKDRYGYIHISLNLDAYGSLFVIFSDHAGAESQMPVLNKKLKEVELTGAWNLYFPEENAGAGPIEFDSLVFWNERQEDGIRFFSGIATYGKVFEWEEEATEEGQQVFLEFDQIVEVARVYLNNEDLGILWKRPFRVDITDALIHGKNSLRVEVANTWANGLAGDARNPMEKRRTKTNVTRLPNAWTYPLQEIPNEDYDLLEGGIAGKVIISSFETN
ncbi:MAG: glycosyl hydrolase [Bacteroidota bacterium]